MPSNEDFREHAEIMRELAAEARRDGALAFLAGRDVHDHLYRGFFHDWEGGWRGAAMDAGEDSCTVTYGRDHACGVCRLSRERKAAARRY